MVVKEIINKMAAEGIYAAQISLIDRTVFTIVLKDVMYYIPQCLPDCGHALSFQQVADKCAAMFQGEERCVETVRRYIKRVCEQKSVPIYGIIPAAKIVEAGGFVSVDHYFKIPALTRTVYDEKDCTYETDRAKICGGLIFNPEMIVKIEPVTDDWIICDAEWEEAIQQLEESFMSREKDCNGSGLITG